MRKKTSDEDLVLALHGPGKQEVTGQHSDCFSTTGSKGQDSRLYWRTKPVKVRVSTSLHVIVD
jgi:hypothetical protein